MLICAFFCSGIKELSHSIKNDWTAYYRCLQYRALTIPGMLLDQNSWSCNNFCRIMRIAKRLL